MTQTYQYKTYKVEVIQWTGKNYGEVKAFLGDVKVHREDSSLRILHNGFSYVECHEWIIKSGKEIITDHNSNFIQTFEKVSDGKPVRRRFIQALNKIKGMKKQIGWDIDDQGYSAKDTLQEVFENIDHILEEFDIDTDKLMSEL